MSNPDFPEFMRALGMKPVSSSADPIRPVAEAQRDELKIRFKRYHDDLSIPLTPGTIVKEKQGLGFRRKEYRDDYVLMYWRALSPQNPVDMLLIEDCIKHVPMATVDCIVAELTDDGSAVVFQAHDSAQLEPA